MFKPFTAALVVVTACTLAAPAALAQARPDAAQPPRAEERLQGRQMTQHGASVPFLVSHAYREALHTHESVAMGMNDMARNHLANVRIVLGHIDLDRDVTDQRLRNELTRLRDRAEGLKGDVSLKDAGDLVSRFTNVIVAMPVPAGGGGGKAGVTPMVLLPAELVAKATASAADLQVDVAQRNFAGAKLHAQHAVDALDAAVQSAQLNKMSSRTIRELQDLRGRAEKVQRTVIGHSPKAIQEAGQLVQHLGKALPSLTAAHGGGAGRGMGQEKRER